MGDADGNFQFDVFLSHSSLDKATVRPLAERLRADGLRVWFDAWEIKAGDSIPAKFEGRLEQPHFGFRIADCGFAQPGMSANAFGSDWAQLESGTFRFQHARFGAPVHPGSISDGFSPCAPGHVRPQ